MRQTKESNKRAAGRIVIYISVHLASIFNLAFSINVLLVLALNFMVHDVKWEPFFYLQSEHIPSEWENTRSDMLVLTEIKKNPTTTTITNIYNMCDICEKNLDSNFNQAAIHKKVNFDEIALNFKYSQKSKF